MVGKSLVARLIAGLDIRGPDDCWLWQKSCKTPGYGQLGGIMPNGKQGMVDAHRTMYELAWRPIPKGKYIVHSCEGRYAKGDITYRRCCNPAHLRATTQRDNIRDLRGTKRGHLHLSDDAAMLIMCYKLAGRTNVDIGKVFACVPSQVSKICHLRQHTDNPLPYTPRSH